MIDDHDELCARMVGFGKEASAQKANTHRRKEIANNLGHCREVHARAWRSNISIDDERLIVVNTL